MAIRKRKSKLRLWDKIRLGFVFFLIIGIALSYLIINLSLTYKRSAAERPANIGFSVWMQCLKIASVKSNAEGADTATTRSDYLALLQDCMAAGGAYPATPTPAPTTLPTPTSSITPTPAPSSMPTSTPTPGGSTSLTWATPFILGNGNKLPAVAIDSNGQSHYVWWESPSGKIWYKLCTSSSCLAAVQISTGGHVSYYPNITIDSDGNPNIVWESKVGGSAVYAVFFSKESNGQWTNAKQLSQEAYAEEPDIAIGVNGTIYIVYEAKPTHTAGSVYYTTSTDGGVNWSVSSKIGDGLWPRVAVDKNNQVNVVWNGNPSAYGIFYRYQSGGSWVAQQTVSSAHHEQTPDIRIDGSNHVQIVWGNYDTYTVGYTTYVNGQSQGMQTNVSGGLSLALWPKIALDPTGKAHIIFQGKSSGTIWSIYFVSQSGSSWSAPVLLKKETTSVQSPQIDIRGADGAVTYTDGTTVYGQSFSLQ